MTSPTYIAIGIPSDGYYGHIYLGHFSTLEAALNRTNWEGDYSDGAYVIDTDTNETVYTCYPEKEDHDLEPARIPEPWESLPPATIHSTKVLHGPSGQIFDLCFVPKNTAAFMVWKTWFSIPAADREIPIISRHHGYDYVREDCYVLHNPDLGLKRLALYRPDRHGEFSWGPAAYLRDISDLQE